MADSMCLRAMKRSNASTWNPNRVKWRASRPVPAKSTIAIGTNLCPEGSLVSKFRSSCGMGVPFSAPLPPDLRRLAEGAEL
eukprot:4687553-Amphidinium_carterae.1